MRTTIDIPDAVYRELKVKAAQEGRTVRELVLRSVEGVLKKTDASTVHKLDLPLIRSAQPGTLHLTNEQVDELTAFS